MKPKGFDYIKADTIEEALDCLAANGENAKIISGGNSMMAMLNFRLLEPKVLIDISRLETLSGIEDKEPLSLLGRIEVTVMLIAGICIVGMLTGEIVAILVKKAQRVGKVAIMPPQGKLERHFVILGHNAHLDSVFGHQPGTGDQAPQRLIIVLDRPAVFAGFVIGEPAVVVGIGKV